LCNHVGSPFYFTIKSIFPIKPYASMSDMNKLVDLRSDTFTKPTPAMLQAMFRAPVGDDVFGEDPSINQLEELSAGMFGMEAGLFCPSGTMTNQIAINVHTRPGDEVICDELSHVYIYEGGGIAFNSGSQVKPLRGNRGRVTAQLVEEAINPDDIHKARTRLVSLENTANRGGGSCYDFQDITAVKEVCQQHGLGFHLDGARLFNAIVAKSETPEQYGQTFDSISICLSKGLGTPVGSVLLGQRDFIKEARRVRKKLGGGMRQAGYLAAAGIYALENNIQRLAEDHAHARQAEAVLKQKEYVKHVLPVETNIVIVELKETHTAAWLVDQLKQHNILCLPISKQGIRLVYHLDVPEEGAKRVLEVLQQID
jgi:threonine aldolase